MKKIISLLLALTMIFALAACSSDKTDSESVNTPAPEARE
jgi:uncharacterized lipoprotein YehR (DUF1307 family)